MTQLSSTTPRRANASRIAGGMLATAGLVAGLLAFGAGPASAQEASPPGFGDCGNARTTAGDLDRGTIVDQKYSNNRYAEVVYEVNGHYEHWRADAATAAVGRVACKPKPVNEQQPPRFGGGGGGAGLGGGGISFLGWSGSSYSGTVTVGSLETVQE